MALTKFVKGKFRAKDSLPRLVEYITDPEKTSPELIRSSCGTSDPQEVVERMMATKELWEKTGGVQLFHDVVALTLFLLRNKMEISMEQLMNVCGKHTIICWFFTSMVNVFHV